MRNGMNVIKAANSWDGLAVVANALSVSREFLYFPLIKMGSQKLRWIAMNINYSRQYIKEYYVCRTMPVPAFAKFEIKFQVPLLLIIWYKQWTCCMKCVTVVEVTTLWRKFI